MEREIRTSGYWRISNKDSGYNGKLYINQDTGIIQLTLYFLSQMSPLSYLEVPLEIDFITGEMLDGARITLLHCKRCHTQSFVGTREEYTYTARFLVNGHCFENVDQILFTQMNFNMSNMFDWGAISKYEYDYSNNGSETDYILKAQNMIPILLFDNGKYKISYTVQEGRRSFGAEIEEIIIRQKPNIIIETQEGMPIDFFIEILNIIKRVVELANGVAVNPIEICGTIYKIRKYIGPHDYPLELEIFHCFVSEKNYFASRLNEYLFNLAELRDKGNLVNWFEKYSLLEPVIELYIENLRSPSSSTRIHFLNIVQALETYHSRVICNGSLSDYKKRVDRIVACLEGANKIEKRDFLLQKNERKLQLNARIADLLAAEYTLYFYTGKVKYTDFPKKISDTRNYLTHYNAKNEDLALRGEELSDSCFVLTCILEYYLLIELGFDSAFSREKVGEKLKQLRTSIDIKDVDRKKSRTSKPIDKPLAPIL